VDSPGAVGDGVIDDFARHNRQLTGLDLERRRVRVGAGVVLDQLNTFLKPHSYCFGPDVATSSRATLGGMIANNSSGARVPVYGTTADHVLALEIVLADGRIATIGPDLVSLGQERQRIAALVTARAAEIGERMPPGMLKRWSGYALERFLDRPQNLSEILAGSEGTLAAIFSAEWRAPSECWRQNTISRSKSRGRWWRKSRSSRPVWSWSPPARVAIIRSTISLPSIPCTWRNCSRER
jgi:FAD/FMN-containing dehydrogenase